jgi:predicted SAM-dependent methyltransferase
MKIDLGCGAHKSEGLLGVDILEHPNVDIQHDLNIFPWPFENDSVENHVLEHVANFIDSVEEIWRISKSGAIIEVRCPHASCFPTVWADPTHKRAMVKNSFMHWGGKVKIFMHSRVSLQWKRSDCITVYIKAKEMDR